MVNKCYGMVFVNFALKSNGRLKHFFYIGDIDRWTVLSANTECFGARSCKSCYTRMAPLSAPLATWIQAHCLWDAVGYCAKYILFLLPIFLEIILKRTNKRLKWLENPN
jgi:hypothetical protein